jgi:hypothetical protein
MSEYRMLKCPVGHIWDPRISGKMCPTCGVLVGNEDKSRPLPRAVEELDTQYLYKYIEPGVGWLTCISGACRGMSFTLHEDMNFIGRGDQMDVQILGDADVIRTNHACIAYDKINRKFTLIPGGNAMVYLNNTSIYAATELIDLSRIRVGNTILVFRPLCGEHFSWDTADTQDGYDSYGSYEKYTGYEAYEQYEAYGQLGQMQQDDKPNGQT